MDPKHLMQLAVILDKGSITAASAHLLLTQPTLTRNMATLEMQAGGLLFSRSRFGVRATRLGESLAREGRHAARTVQAAQEAVQRHRMGLNNQVRVAVGPLIGMAAMPRVAEILLAEMPHLSLAVTSGRPQALVDQLIDGEHDLVIAPAVYEHTPEGISRQRLTEDTIGVYCAASHPLAQATAPKPEALEACNWLNVGITSPFQNVQFELLASAGVKNVRTQLVTVGDAVILLDVLAQGRHLAVLPGVPIELLRPRYDFRKLPLSGAPSRRDLYVWCREDLADKHMFQTFFRVAQQVVEANRQGPASH